VADSKLPYLNAYGNVTKVLEKIQGAATPDRFSQDFLADTLGMKGGSARPVIPYLKRTGFLGADAPPPRSTRASATKQRQVPRQRARCESGMRLCSRWLRLHTRSTTPS
jgi:hypothetical protein